MMATNKNQTGNVGRASIAIKKKQQPSQTARRIGFDDPASAFCLSQSNLPAVPTRRKQRKPSRRRATGRSSGEGTRVQHEPGARFACSSSKPARRVVRYAGR